MSLRIEFLAPMVLRAGRDLARPAILFQVVWPPLAALALWLAAAFFVWTPAVAWVGLQLPGWAWLAWLDPWLAHVVVFLAFLPLVYVTALLLLGAFALPRMMAIIAARDYPDVARQGSTAAALWGGLWNSLSAGAIFVVGWLATLPLLLIPGALLVLPLLWSAWLNQRSLRFDALAEHALPQELECLCRREKGNFYAAGVLSALVGYVPVLNLLAPGFAALLFSHLSLGALRELRRAQGAPGVPGIPA